MDEIDAALDFMNVSIVANYIRHRTRNAQFIIISLRQVLITSYPFMYADMNVGMICLSSVTVLSVSTRPPMRLEVSVGIFKL